MLNQEYAPLIRDRLRDAIALMELGVVDPILAMAAALVTTYRRGGKVLLFGNGGSAAQAAHLAGEFAGFRRPLPAIALADNAAVVTAISNDHTFERLFDLQVLALGMPSDVAVAFSTSGRSANVQRGVLAATQKGLVTIGLTGRDGGWLQAHVDHCICAPSTVTARIQEYHLFVCHVVAEIVERELAGP